MAGPVTHEALTLVDQLPVLPVLVPFLAAPLIAVIGSRRAAWPIAMAASIISFICSILLMLAVSDGSEIGYQLGGWEPPFGIEYRIDALNALIMTLISGIAVVTLPYALKSLHHHVAEKHHTLLYSCFMLTMVGLMGVCITGDAFNIFVFLEISSLSTYVLVAMGAEHG